MRLLAALIFFTRLPFWRIAEVPPRYYKEVVNYWPLVGWLTGGVMAGILWLTSHCFSWEIAVLLTMLSRILLTGALHEDGLADFCDGFGGGTTRERILSIMKDSHNSTYGVIGLICYLGMFYLLIYRLPMAIAPWLIVGFDTWSKFCSAQIINLLPYTRKEEESKARVIYNRMSPGNWIMAFICGLLPLVPALLACPSLVLLLPVPLLVTLALVHLMRKKIQGYTGDCCGATFLLSELALYLMSNCFFTHLP